MATSSSSPPPKLRLLFLEDDPEQSPTWAAQLRRWGYDVVPVSTASQAIQLATEQYFHIGVFDKSMNLEDFADTQGLVAAETILHARKSGAYLPIVMLTYELPSAREVVRSMSAGGGVFDFVEKAEARRKESNGVPRLLNVLRLAEASLRLNRDVRISAGDTIPDATGRYALAWLANQVEQRLSLDEQENADLARLQVQVFDLLAGLFNDPSYTDIEIGQLPTGFSGAIVLTAVPWRREAGAARAEMREVTSIVKMGPRGKIQRERIAVLRTQNFVQGHRTALVTGSAETRDLAALRLQFIGLDVRQSSTLESILPLVDNRAFCMLIDDLFGFVFQLMHQQISRPEEANLARKYRPGDMVRVNLPRAFEAVFPRERSQHFIEVSRYSPQPLRTFVYDLADVEFPPDVCWDVMCHGDLHGRNILVHDDRCWLIDLARCRPGPLLRDFVSLEAWLLFEVLGKRNTVEARRAMVLLGNEVPKSAPDYVEGNDEVSKVISGALTIRDYATRVARRQWVQIQAQYYAGLFYAIVEQLRWCEADAVERAELLVWALNLSFQLANGVIRPASPRERRAD